jgi:elongation factor G
VFKTLADPFIGKLTYFRVHSGTLRPTATLERQQGEGRRFGSVFTMRA